MPSQWVRRFFLVLAAAGFIATFGTATSGANVEVPITVSPASSASSTPQRDTAIHLAEGATPTSGASPSDSEPATGINSTTGLSHNYLLAYFFAFIPGIIVLFLLIFLYFYHAKILKVIEKAVLKGTVRPITTTESSIITQGDASTKTQSVAPDSGPPVAMSGPAFAQIGRELVYELTGITDPTGVIWTAEKGEPSITENKLVFRTEFKTAEKHTVSVEYTSASQTATLTREVIITGADNAIPTVSLPFVVRNWGRLVVMIFGLGTIASLMAAGALDSVAGVGILGTLLGVGAVISTSGSSGEEKPKS